MPGIIITVQVYKLIAPIKSECIPCGLEHMATKINYDLLLLNCRQYLHSGVQHRFSHQLRPSWDKVMIEHFPDQSLHTQQVWDWMFRHCPEIWASALHSSLQEIHSGSLWDGMSRIMNNTVSIIGLIYNQQTFRRNQLPNVSIKSAGKSCLN